VAMFGSLFDAKTDFKIIIVIPNQFHIIIIYYLGNFNDQ